MKSTTRVARFGVVLCISAVLLGACSGERPEQLVASAKDYLSRNDAKAATIQLKNALQKAPDLAEARYLLGVTLLESGDVLAAEKELTKARELKYPAEQLNAPLARLLLAQGKYQQVLDQFADARAATPRGQAELMTALGQAQLALGETAAARASLAAARSADAQYAPILTGEALLAAQSGDLAGALKHAEAAVVASPANPDVWHLKGNILLAQQQMDAAAEAYRKAIEVSATYLPAHAALVQLLLNQGKLEPAAKALGYMKQVAPTHPQTFYLEVLVRAGERNFPAARDAIQEYLRRRPDDLNGMLLAGSIDLQLRSFGEAESKLTKVLQEVPGHRPARRMLIGAYVESGQIAKAIDTLKPVLADIDKDPAMLNMAGEVFLRNGQRAAAEKYFEKAAAIDPAGTRQKTGIALAHLAEGNIDRGVNELKAISNTDEGIRADVVLAMAMLEKREYDKALNAIDAMEKKQPGKPLTQNLRGLALMGKQDLAAARSSFERALSLDPNFFAATLNLVRVDIAQKKPAEAEKRLEAVIAKDPKNSNALLTLAELRARNRASQQEVLQLLNKAVAAQPTDTRARIALINYYLREKDGKKAVAAGQEALAAIPGRPDLLERLALAYTMAGARNQALATYQEMAKVAPTSPVPFVHIAELNLASKDYDEAIRNLNRALAIQPDLVTAQRRLIAAHVAADRLPDAIKVARNVQKQRPKESVGYVLEGDVYASKKTWKEAITAYRTAVKQAGTSDAAIKLHSALRAANENAEADRFSAAWQRDHPDDAAYRLYLAEVALRHGDYADALKHYQWALARKPDNPILLNNVAWTAGMLQDPQAFEYAERAHRLAPDEPKILDTLGMLLVERGDTARGIDMLQRASSLAPDAATIRLHLAQALIKGGQKDAARKQLEELSKLGDKYVGHDEVARLLRTL